MPRMRRAPSAAHAVEIGFRCLAEEDLPALFGWLARAHVVKGYGDAPGTYAEMLARFGPRTSEGNPVRAFVVTLDGRDAGYAQTYAVEDFPEYAESGGIERGVAGVDLFLADAASLGQGLGSRVIRRFVDDVVFRTHGATACVADPAESNAAALGAFAKAGFRRARRITPAGSEPRWLMRRDNSLGDYRIERIDLGQHAELCAAFHREMYVASFGTDAGLDEEMGADNAVYLAALAQRIEQVPEGNIHLWRGDRVVAQAEMRLLEEDASIGYVNLFYVAADCRGEGLGRALHEHAVDVFRRRGSKAMRLTVSISNARAIGFYRRLGWEAIGTRPHREPVVVMEYRLD
jgi:ribosomal protein S18 acetylase RimI-like enzyme